MAISLATMQTWLDDAKTARQALVSGTRSTSLAFSTGAGNRSYGFQSMTLAELNTYIADLEAQIADATGATKRRSVTRIQQTGTGYGR